MEPIAEGVRARLRAWLALPPTRPVAVASPETPAKSAEALYCDVARARLQDQLSLVSSFDTKATTMLTIGSTVLPISASLLVSGPAGNFGILGAHHYSQIALEVAAGCYVLLVSCFLRVLNLGGWDTRPELEQWRDITPGVTEEAMLR